MVLENMGIWSIHIQNSYGTEGLPDRYLSNGFWIECKSVLMTRKRGSEKRLKRLLRRSQKRTIPKLIARGDKVFIALFVHEEGEPTRFHINSYRAFLEMDERVLDSVAVPWGISNPKTSKAIFNALRRKGFPLPERGIHSPAIGEAV